MAFDETGLPFIPPSPNLRRWRASSIIPASASSRAPTSRSAAGRTRRSSRSARHGSTPPRCSPASGGPACRAWSSGRSTFTPARPGDGKYADTLVLGIRLEMTDRERYDPTARCGPSASAAIRDSHPEQLPLDPAHFDRLAGGPALREAIEAGRRRPVIVAWLGTGAQALPGTAEPAALSGVAVHAWEAQMDPGTAAPLPRLPPTVLPHYPFARQSVGWSAGHLEDLTTQA